MKKILIFFYFIYVLISCTNYFNSAQTKVQSDKPLYQKVQLGEPLDTIGFYLHGDYQRFHKNKEFIWIENKEFKKLLDYKFPSKSAQQILFTFTNISEYNNLFGFYYDDLKLDSIKKNYRNTDHYKGKNGISYFYNYKDFKVSDTFIKKDSGTIRFITLNNPDFNKDLYKDYYYKEINHLLFEANEHLWGNLEDFDLITSTPYGNYLKFINSQNDTTSFGGQIKATALSFIHDYDTRNMVIKRLFQYNNRQQIEVPKEYKAIDAKEFILKQTKDKSVVMFNEHHMNPENRIFLASMLKDLKEQDFNVLALEALMYDSLAIINETPTLNSGFYTCEPEFGNLIRKAKELGYEILAYEDTTKNNLNGIEQANFRDSVQAKNLTDIYKKHKKLLVYAGHGHIEEKESNGWKKRAQRFYEITNVDPYTIEQAAFSNFADASFNNSETEKIVVPSVFVNDEKEVWVGQKGFYDVQVIFPHSTDWYDLTRVPYTFKFNKKFGENTVHIYKSTDNVFRNPVPVAVQEIVYGQDNSFYLPENGKYKLFVLTEYGQVLYQEEINL